MKLICPECKNDVDLNSFSDVKINDVVECNTCGITLLITAVSNANIQAEIVDEGK